MSNEGVSSTSWVKWGAIGCGVLAVVCCGMCGGATFFGMDLTEEQTCAALAEHPGVTERVGAQRDCAIAWDALAQSSADSDTLPYRVTGDNGAVLLDVSTESLGADAELVTGVTLIQDDGTRVPLDGEPARADEVAGGVAVPAAGATVRIVEIASDDAYYGDRGALVNRPCVVGDDVRESAAGGGWLAGTFVCGTDSPYFYKVKVE